jgi:hypothetical protein
MYTLNLKDLKIDPPINDDHSISGDNESKIVVEMLRYISEKHPGKHNPYTLSRKLSEIVKDDSGKISFDRKKEAEKEKKAELYNKVEEEHKKLSAEIEAEQEIIQKEMDEIFASYRKILKDLLDKKIDVQMSKELTEEEKDKQVDEIETEREKVEWERDQKIKDMQESVRNKGRI